MLFSGAFIKTDGITGELVTGWLTLKKLLTARITIPPINKAAEQPRYKSDPRRSE